MNAGTITQRRYLARDIALILASHKQTIITQDSTDSGFMLDLQDALEEHGLTMCFQQHGARGTSVSIDECVPTRMRIHTPANDNSHNRLLYVGENGEHVHHRD